jgi:signal transduction histidine kinase
VGSSWRQAAWVSALAIAVFQVVGTFGASDNQPERHAIDALAVVLVLIGPVALAVRQRWPLLAVAVAAASADVYIALGYPYGPIFFGVAVALFNAVQAGHRRTTWALAAAGYGGYVVATFLDPSTDGPGALHLVAAAGWLAVVLAVSEVARTRRAAVAEAEQAEHQERQRRRSEQRLVLAQELHDVLAHHISLINVQAGVALHLIDEQPEQARPALTNIKAASSEALHQLRAALDLLRRGEDAPRAPSPVLADLDALVAGVRAGGLDVRLEHDDPAPPLPAAVELAAYRIVQEALTNVTRHARARHVNVRLDYADGVRIEVSDDGVGGAVHPGNGIVGMQERAAALGGRADADAGPEGGFRVVAHLPLATERSRP